MPVSPRLLAVLQKHKEAGKAKGVPWNLLPLRHTFGSQLARKGVSLLKIAQLMGNSPAIAAKHINLVPEEMADEIAF